MFLSMPQTGAEFEGFLFVREPAVDRQPSLRGCDAGQVSSIVRRAHLSEASQ